MTFREQLVELKACSASLEWVKNKSLEEAWETCENSGWMFWILSKTDLNLINPICDMAERVLDLVPEDNRLACSNAINSARRCASKEELTASSHAACEAAHAACAACAYGSNSVSYSANHSAYNAANAAYYASYAALAFYHDFGANSYSYYADMSVSNAAYAAITYFEERKKQCDILRKYFTIDQVLEAFNKLVA